MREMAASGQLDAFCERHDLDLLVVHGSVLDEQADAGDLDLAVWPRRGGAFDLVALYGELPAVLGHVEMDVMDLSRAGVVPGRPGPSRQPG
jgi:predicted nucleotidyltransferase